MIVSVRKVSAARVNVAEMNTGLPGRVIGIGSPIRLHSSQVDPSVDRSAEIGISDDPISASSGHPSS